jgi:hypothetical protein
VDTRFTPLSVCAYSNVGVRVVHCLLSSGICRALSATVSASSFRGSPRCALILTMNVRAPRMTLARKHSIIVFMMSTLASPASVVRGPLPIHLDTLVKVVLLSHRYSKSVPADVACSVRASAASSGRTYSFFFSPHFDLKMSVLLLETDAYPHPSLLCGLIRLPPMSLLGSHNSLDVQLPCLANNDVRGSCSNKTHTHSRPCNRIFNSSLLLSCSQVACRP